MLKRELNESDSRRMKQPVSLLRQLPTLRKNASTEQAEMVRLKVQAKAEKERLEADEAEALTKQRIISLTS